MVNTARAGFAVVAAGLLATVGPHAAARAAEQSGIAVAVVQMSEVDGATGRKVLRASAPVFQGDIIKTGAVGEAQIRLLDETRLVVGPNSLMVIDSFVFDRTRSVQKVTLNVARGAFRFITGKGRKDAYSIVTPTATIGVRGTTIDFTVEGGSGRAHVLTTEGISDVCTRDDQGRRSCVESTECGLTIVDRGRRIRQVEARAERNRDIQFYLPYVLSQERRLLADFHADIDSCGDLSTPVVPGGGPTLLAPPPPPPPAPPPPAPPPPEPTPDKGNKGLGNGPEGDDGSFATAETNNPGKGQGKDHGGSGGKGKDK
jgi:hypothetical protein